MSDNLINTKNSNKRPISSLPQNYYAPSLFAFSFCATLRVEIMADEPPDNGMVDGTRDPLRTPVMFQLSLPAFFGLLLVGKAD